MTGEASPTDGRFRRGVYVMLVVLGLLAASSGIWARDGAERAARAERAQSATADALREALKQNAALLAGQAAAARRDDAATQRDLRGERERAALKVVLAQLLAKSSDPAVSRAFSPYAQPPPLTSGAPRHSSSPSPRPSSQPTPKPSPSPTPSPSATCTPLPILGCVRP